MFFLLPARQSQLSALYLCDTRGESLPLSERWCAAVFSKTLAKKPVRSQAKAYFPPRTAFRAILNSSFNARIPSSSDKNAATAASPAVTLSSSSSVVFTGSLHLLLPTRTLIGYLIPRLKTLEMFITLTKLVFFVPGHLYVKNLPFTGHNMLLKGSLSGTVSNTDQNVLS